jgi:hypothetical protein
MAPAPRPGPDEYAPFFAGYVSLVPETDVLAVLAAQPSEIRRLAAAIPADRETFRYAPGKWSVREILGHVGDGERVFGYRAFCAANVGQLVQDGAVAGWDGDPDLHFNVSVVPRFCINLSR